MKISSTITDKWRFCIFASFLSCIILLVFLNQGHDSEKLSGVQNITLSATTSSNDSAQHPAASMQHLEPSNVGEHEKEANEEEHGDNLAQQPAANIQFLQPSNVGEHEKETNKEEHSGHLAQQPAASIQFLEPSYVGEHDKETNEEDHSGNLAQQPAASIQFLEPSYVGEHEKEINEEDHSGNSAQQPAASNQFLEPSYVGEHEKETNEEDHSRNSAQQPAPSIQFLEPSYVGHEKETNEEEHSGNSAQQPAASIQFLEPSHVGEHVKEINKEEHSGNLAPHPAASMQFLQPSNVGEHENETNEVEHVCNIFDGKWVYDPTASPMYNRSQCPFLSDQVSCQRNGRPDFVYEKWNWEAKGCEIPRFNGTDTLERLRGKRVIIVGDSLNRNQWESLACLLYSAIPIPSSQAYVNVKSGDYKVLRAKDYNCSVEFYWSPFLIELKERRGKKIMRLDKLSASAQNWHGAHIMVFNTGHWWNHPVKIKEFDFFQYRKKVVEVDKIETGLAFEMAMKTWARWIDKTVDINNTKVFFRSISPEHKGKQWCYNETKLIMDESYKAIFPKSMVEIVERTISSMKKPVKYLNITKLSQYRRDAHPSVYTTKQGKLLTAMQRRQPWSYADCSHWCLPGLPDTWNRLVYASMVLDKLPRYF
ncbi:protein trichome birefringence-like 3 [Quercus suber]|uniref:Protein trichome birefringence-like 3 n=1 Tax=Quercus suber TaxID=58331 RepID=A0AAW0L8E4_QUESU